MQGCAIHKKNHVKNNFQLRKRVKCVKIKIRIHHCKYVTNTCSKFDKSQFSGDVMDLSSDSVSDDSRHGIDDGNDKYGL